MLQNDVKVLLLHLLFLKFATGYFCAFGNAKEGWDMAHSDNDHKCLQSYRFLTDGFQIFNVLVDVQFGSRLPLNNPAQLKFPSLTNDDKFMMEYNEFSSMKQFCYLRRIVRTDKYDKELAGRTRWKCSSHYGCVFDIDCECTGQSCNTVMRPFVYWKQERYDMHFNHIRFFFAVVASNRVGERYHKNFAKVLSTNDTIWFLDTLHVISRGELMEKANVSEVLGRGLSKYTSQLTALTEEDDDTDYWTRKPTTNLMPAEIETSSTEPVKDEGGGTIINGSMSSSREDSYMGPVNVLVWASITFGVLAIIVVIIIVAYIIFQRVLERNDPSSVRSEVSTRSDPSSTKRKTIRPKKLYNPGGVTTSSSSRSSVIGKRTG